MVFDADDGEDDEDEEAREIKEVHDWNIVTIASLVVRFSWLRPR